MLQFLLDGERGGGWVIDSVSEKFSSFISELISLGSDWGFRFVGFKRDKKSPNNSKPSWDLQCSFLMGRLCVVFAAYRWCDVWKWCLLLTWKHLTAYQKTHPGLSREATFKMKPWWGFHAVPAESFYSKRRQQRVRQPRRSWAVTQVCEKARGAAGWEQTKPFVLGLKSWEWRMLYAQSRLWESCPVALLLLDPEMTGWWGGASTFVSVSSEQWHQIWQALGIFREANFMFLWSEVKVPQSCLILCNPMDDIVHGILQARICEWVAFPFFRGSSQTRDQTQVSHIAGRLFTSWTTREAQVYLSG